MAVGLAIATAYESETHWRNYLCRNIRSVLSGGLCHVAIALLQHSVRSDDRRHVSTGISVGRAGDYRFGVFGQFCNCLTVGNISDAHAGVTIPQPVHLQVNQVTK